MSQIRRPDTAFALDPVGKQFARQEDKHHLAFIRLLPSVISGQYGVEACHIRMGDPRHRKPRTGAGRKPDDAWTLPMTPDEHRAQHSMNERAFWTQHGVDDPCALALALFQNSGDQEEAERLIRAHLRSIGR